MSPPILYLVTTRSSAIVCSCCSSSPDIFPPPPPLKPCSLEPPPESPSLATSCGQSPFDSRGEREQKREQARERAGESEKGRARGLRRRARWDNESFPQPASSRTSGPLNYYSQPAFRASTPGPGALPYEGLARWNRRARWEGSGSGGKAEPFGSLSSVVGLSRKIRTYQEPGAGTFNGGGRAERRGGATAGKALEAETGWSPDNCG